MATNPLLSALNQSESTVAGLTPHLWPWLLANLTHVAVKAKNPPSTYLLVVPPNVSAGAMARAVQATLGAHAHTLLYPAWDVAPYDRLSPSTDVIGQRLAVHAHLQQKPEVDDENHVIPTVVVAPLEALLTRLHPNPTPPLVLSTGQTLAPATLIQALSGMGYHRADAVQQVGHFSVRGGMLDVWAAGQPTPLRLEWFDDDIETLRPFDPASQRLLPTQAPTHVTLAPVIETPLTDEAISRFRAAYRERGGIEDELYTAISNGIWPAEGTQLSSLLAEKKGVSLLEALPKQSLCLLPEHMDVAVDDFWANLTAAYAARKGAEQTGLALVAPQEMAVTAAEFKKILYSVPTLHLHNFVGKQGAHVLPWKELSYTGLKETTANIHATAQVAAADIKTKLTEGWSIVLTGLTAPSLAQLCRTLEGEGAPSSMPVDGHDLNVALARGQGLAAIVTGITHGWEDPEHKVLVLAEGDVFGARIARSAPKKRRNPADLIAHFSELREGDYVVHEDHGIGQYAGMLTLDLPAEYIAPVIPQGRPSPNSLAAKAQEVAVSRSAKTVRQDFLKIMYAGEDRLLVPIENLEVLTRYKGSESGEVTLDKLGTGGWEARKEKVKEDLMLMAADLIKTAAERELVSRPALVSAGGADGLSYDEFCAGFPYALTDDQQTVMEEVETDLGSDTPMDRLVVGDVGFGKTEVALRAAFLVAQSGKQVAVVCPTTLLARQHADVFAQRFAGSPFTVKALSRLVSSKDAAATKQQLEKGTADVVIGTHALLAKDMRFKDLGLVIIDEEQRFGVAHKERLKQLRAEADILTLTATPIPRTLQMAVGGVRQLSLITTPPVDRQAVQTHVLAWDTPTLQGAITREIARGGQVYIVAPHIEDLPQLQDSLSEMVPAARIVTAHGQMAEGGLEDAMEAFYDHEADILLATTIIESGLDVPRANTIIVYRADRFGLAQLYQLRGRVGRSSRKAFAYFLLPNGPLAGNAAKRLTILQKLEGLGAGFMLASYDMDLRGFGNLLGKQQSGHIREIGFELYSKMLREAVSKLQQRNKEKAAAKSNAAEPASTDRPVAPTTQLKIGLTYLVPETYVADETLRLQLYRRLSNLENAEQLADFEEELKERFGRYPTEVKHLLAVVGLKNRLKNLNVSKLEVGQKGTTVAFHRGRFADPQALVSFMMSHAGVVTARPDMSLVFHRRLGEGDARLKGVETIVTELESLLMQESAV